MKEYEGYIQGFSPYKRIWICEKLTEGSFRCQYEDGREVIMLTADFESYHLFQNCPGYVYDSKDREKSRIWKSRLPPCMDTRKYVEAYGFVDQMQATRAGLTPIHSQWFSKGLPMDTPYGSSVNVPDHLTTYLPDYHPQKEALAVVV